MPLQAGLFPLFVPFFLGSRGNKELHFHLFKFPHAKNKLPGNNFVAKSFSGLCYSKRNLHSTRFLNIEKVDKYSLCRFRTEIQIHGRLGRSAELGAKHEVELFDIGPIARTRLWTSNFKFFDQSLYVGQIFCFEWFSKTLEDAVYFFLITNHPRIGRFELLRVKSLAKPLGGFVDFFLYFILDFGTIVFDQNIGTVAFFRILVINQRIVKRINMTRGFPSGRVHKNGCVDPYDIVVQLHHGFPPIITNVFFEGHPVLTIVINGA